ARQRTKADADRRTGRVGGERGDRQGATNRDHGARAQVSRLSSQRSGCSWSSGSCPSAYFWNAKSATDPASKVVRISVCLGTASTAPVAGFIHRECEPPSRFQPCIRKCCGKVLRHATCCASFDDHDFTFGLTWHGAEPVFAAVGENQGDCAP